MTGNRNATNQHDDESATEETPMNVHPRLWHIVRLSAAGFLAIGLTAMWHSSGDSKREHRLPIAPEEAPKGRPGGAAERPDAWLVDRSGQRRAFWYRQERVESRGGAAGEPERVLVPQPQPALQRDVMPSAPGTCEHGVRWGVACDQGACRGRARWADARPIPWEAFAQGEYVGPARTAHVPEYRLRVDDQLEFIYRLTRLESSTPYELNVGDQIRIESSIDPTLNRDLIVQPDGTITVLLLGQVRAARRTVEELRQTLEEAYKKYYNVPAITVTPLQVNTKLNDLRNAVDRRYGSGGQAQEVRITPDGTIQLPAIGSVPAQGLTLGELKREIDERYAAVVKGIEVMPRLVARAPRYVFVLGEVVNPGRYTLEGPTTAMQAIAMAGGWKFGGNLRHIVVFRRTADWRLVATKLNLNAALLGREPCPADDVWLRDNDILMIPKSGLLLMDDYIDLLFTRGLYGVIPAQFSFNFAKLSSL